MYNLFEQFGVQELAPQEQREVFGGGWLSRFEELFGKTVGALWDALTEPMDHPLAH
jgi:hypothetical protein